MPRRQSSKYLEFLLAQVKGRRVLPDQHAPVVALFGTIDSDLLKRVSKVSHPRVDRVRSTLSIPCGHTHRHTHIPLPSPTTRKKNTHRRKVREQGAGRLRLRLLELLQERGGFLGPVGGRGGGGRGGRADQLAPHWGRRRVGKTRDEPGA